MGKKLFDFVIGNPPFFSIFKKQQIKSQINLLSLYILEGDGFINLGKE